MPLKRTVHVPFQMELQQVDDLEPPQNAPTRAKHEQLPRFARSRLASKLLRRSLTPRAVSGTPITMSRVAIRLLTSALRDRPKCRL